MEGNPLSHYGAQMKLLLALVPALLAGAIAAPVVEAAPRPANRTVYIERTFAETVDLGDSGSSVGDLRAIIAPIAARERNDLLELLDYRVSTRSTLITSQLPVTAWQKPI